MVAVIHRCVWWGDEWPGSDHCPGRQAGQGEGVRGGTYGGDYRNGPGLDRWCLLVNQWPAQAWLCLALQTLPIREFTGSCEIVCV